MKDRFLFPSFTGPARYLIEDRLMSELEAMCWLASCNFTWNEANCYLQCLFVEESRRIQALKILPRIVRIA